MEIDASITFLVGQDQTIIEIRDRDAVARIMKITLTPDQLSSALSRLGDTQIEKCEIIDRVEIIGKKRELKKIEVSTGVENLPYNDRDEVCKPIIDKYVDEKYEGWTPNYYLHSQDSFFTKDGIMWLRTSITRWVEKDGN